MDSACVVVSAAQNVAASGYGSKDVDAGVYTDQCSNSLNAANKDGGGSTERAATECTRVARLKLQPWAQLYGVGAGQGISNNGARQRRLAR